MGKEYIICGFNFSLVALYRHLGKIFNDGLTRLGWPVGCVSGETQPTVGGIIPQAGDSDLCRSREGKPNPTCMHDFIALCS